MRTAAFGLALLLASCARRAAEPAFERLAVLRFENLGTDHRSEWMGRALAEILTTELAPAPAIYAIPPARVDVLTETLGARPVDAPGISAEAPAALVAGANRLGYGEYFVERGTIHARLTIADPSTRRMVRVLEARAPEGDVVAVATALARQIWPQARPYSVRNPAALEAFTEALEASDANTREARLRQALAADPDFGSAFLRLAELKARAHDRAGLVQVLKSASARGAALPESDRASLAALASGLSPDRGSQTRALAALARLTPSDPAAWAGLGRAFLGAHQAAQAAQAYQRAAAIQPEDINLWNQLGYAEAGAGRLRGAVAALNRYQALRPADPNPLDSLGDVHLISGQLAEAERFYREAARVSPGFLDGADFYKAAMARLMTGDVTGADTLFGQYPAARQHRPEWLWISGRRREAERALTAALEGMSAESRAAGYAELALWSLLDGNRSQAAALAERAGASPVGALVRFLTLPSAPPPEWAARAQHLFPGGGAEGQPQAGEVALAYALLLDHEFQPAAALLRKIYDAQGTSPAATTPFELAWALVETGDYGDAAPLLRLLPTPSAQGPAALLAVSFPRIFRLRAQLAEHEGKTADARRHQRLFELLSRP